MKKVIVLILLLAVSITLYISIGFYNIEHTYSSDGSILMTKQSELERCISDNIEAFENVADSIITDDSNMHDYYLKDMMQDDDVITLSDNCNIEWIRIDSDRKRIVFYQTTNSRKKNQIILSYVCRLNSLGGKVWNITKGYPDVNVEETVCVKLYNMIFNNDII